MLALRRFKCVQWMLLAVFAVVPAALFAQQETERPEAVQAKKEEALAKTEATPAKTDKDDKVISGMSILGNQDAPKSLVIVPWKSSKIGDSVGISTMLDDSKL